MNISFPTDKDQEPTVLNCPEPCFKPEMSAPKLN